MTESAIAGLSVAELHDLLTRCDDRRDLDTLLRIIESDELAWQPWPHQTTPPGDWAVWLLMGGRGSGKTDGSAHDMDEHANGPPCDPRLKGGHRMSIVAPTLGDAAESCVNGPSGLKAHNPAVEMVTTTGGTIVRWPNGAEAKLFGGHSPQDVERFRAGGNRCRAWIEEAAAIPYIDAVLAQVPFGHRLGRNPQVVMSTTPKPRPFLTRLTDQARTWHDLGLIGTAVKRWDRVLITHATTDMNPALDPEVREGLYDLYGGTRLGQQELLGILIGDSEGALWTRDLLDANRIMPDALPRLDLTAVGVDPSSWGVKALTEGIVPEPGEMLGKGIETGIVVSGRAANRHVYTCADYSGRLTPAEWGNRAINAYVRWHANRLAPETNMGGALVLANIRAVEQTRRLEGDQLPPIRIVPVRAAVGKRARAEPVAGLSEQHRHHMVGDGMVLLEDQMCQWDANESWSPDRIDGMVWSVSSCEPWRAHSGSMAARPRGAVR